MDQHALTPKDIRRAQDLQKLPPLTKEIVRREKERLLAASVGQMKVSWTKTGGTTGEPMRICKNIECKAWSNMCLERGLRWGGKSVDEPVIRLVGGALGIDKTSVTSRIGKMLRRDLFLPAFELRADTAPDYFRRIRRSECRFLIGYASAIYRLAMLANQSGETLRFTAVFPTAELMLPEWQQAIRETFRCVILPYYGCGEVNALGFSSPQTDGYLIPEEHSYIEVDAKDGEGEAYGDGRFLVTDLDNYAMPIIRYANGDAGQIAAATGSLPYSRIQRLDGRYNSFLMNDDGELISGVLGTHVFRHTVSVQNYRIVQEEPLRIVVQIVPKGELSENERHLIHKLLGQHLGPKMKITIEKVSDLPVPPSGKSVFVVNRCLQ